MSKEIEDPTIFKILKILGPGELEKLSSSVPRGFKTPLTELISKKMQELAKQAHLESLGEDVPEFAEAEKIAENARKALSEDYDSPNQKNPYDPEDLYVEQEEKLEDEEVSDELLKKLGRTRKKKERRMRSILGVEKWVRIKNGLTKVGIMMQKTELMESYQKVSDQKAQIQASLEKQQAGKKNKVTKGKNGILVNKRQS